MKCKNLNSAALALFVGSVALLSSAPALAQIELPQQTLTVNTELVLVPVSVLDSNSRPLMSLTASDFRLWEDRIEQDITQFSSETVPASIGVILDVSSSMENILTVARDAVVTFLNAGHTEDEYFLMEFNDSPRVTENFTGDVDLLQNRLIQAPPVGRTALYDAIYNGIAEVQRGENPRKALLVITDGEDNHSRYSRSNIEQYVRESGVQIYAIGISATFGKAPLRSLAEMTGGRAVFAGSAAELESICRELAIEMKSQYVLGYVSSNQERDGDWRELRVRIERDRDEAPATVRSRRGYYGSTF